MSERSKKILISCGVFAAMAGFVWLGDTLGQKAQEHFTTAVSAPVVQRTQVALDAGHGGADGGCVSVNGVAEKGINLDIALTGRDMLNIMGFDVVMTRDTDRSLHDDGITGLAAQKKSDMSNRLAVFDSCKGIALSVHQNQFTDSRYSGAQVFYSRKNSSGEQLAAVLQHRFAALLQPDNHRETKPVDDELFLLDKTDTPAVMVECGFLSNPDEAALLETPEYRRKVAFTIMTGLLEYTSAPDTSKG